MKEALERLYADGDWPNLLDTDYGGEWRGPEVTARLQEKGRS